MTRYLEVPMQHDGSASEVDSHRCSRGEACASLEPKPVGWVLDESDDGPYRAGWEYPFVPEGADPLDTSLWVCEDCACELEEACTCDCTNPERCPVHHTGRNLDR